MPENEALELNSIIFPQRSIAYFDVRTPPFCHTIAGGRWSRPPKGSRGGPPRLGAILGRAMLERAILLRAILLRAILGRAMLGRAAQGVSLACPLLVSAETL